MTHEQYLDEPAHLVDWALAFKGVEAKVQEDAMEKAKNKK